MKIETVVVGVDFSEQSEAAVEQALAIARHAGARLALLHVGLVPESPAGVPDSMTTTVTAYTRVAKEQLARDRAALESLRERIEGQGVAVSQAVIDGFPDTGVVEGAGELGADLTVVGTHGRTGLKRFLLGSVAERVVRLSKNAVLVARDRGKARGQGVYRKILVPTDFSDTAEKALVAATQLLTPGGEIHLVNFWQLPPMTGAFYAPVKAADDLFAELRQDLAKAALRSLGELSERHGKGVTIHVDAREESAAHGIQEWAETHEPDLVVTGSHGRRGVRRFLLGSVAEMTVRHAPCSVLVVHGDPES